MDESGAALPGVSVTATSPAQIGTLTVTTNEEGMYRFPSVPPGEYKLEFGLPKFNMYRRVLARVLAQDFVRERGWSETRAVALGRRILRDNVESIFNV